MLKSVKNWFEPRKVDPPAPETPPNEEELYKAAEEFTLKNFTFTIATVVAGFIVLLLLLAIVWRANANPKDVVAVIYSAMLWSFIFGGAPAAFFSPLNEREQTQFNTIRNVIATVVAAIAAVNWKEIVGFASTKLTVEQVNGAPLLVTLLSCGTCFLSGIMLSFVIRAAIVDRNKNRRDVQLRRLWELKNNISAPAPLPAAAAPDRSMVVVGACAIFSAWLLGFMAYQLVGELQKTSDAVRDQSGLVKALIAEQQKTNALLEARRAEAPGTEPVAAPIAQPGPNAQPAAAAAAPRAARRRRR